jgi:pyridoxamine 5'-phosphate oxidase
VTAPIPERRDYQRSSLAEADLHDDPIALFARWFAEAVDAGLDEPNAMVLATADASGRPSARVVLLKDFDARGFTFFTNYQSRKGRDLAENPSAALAFHWAPLERQVRIEGRVELVDAMESDAYFQTRPELARIGAWASSQSRPLADRRVLEDQIEVVRERFAGGEIPRPPHWGGYRVVPSAIEFWQGRASRLHDRFTFTRSEREPWTWSRLYP